MGIPLYIFDLDGSLALIDHRRPFLDDTLLSSDERWRKFFAACVDDVPNKPILETMWQLNRDSDTWIWSGRSDEVREATLIWLSENIDFCDTDAYPLRMRQAGDMRPDVELKQSWLDEMSSEDRARLVMVFDDRDCVVDMWRRNGITCAQVARGDF